MTNRAVVFCVKGLHIMLTVTAITSLINHYESDDPLKILVILEGGYQEDIDFVRQMPQLYGKGQISIDFWTPPYEMMGKVSDHFETGTKLPKMVLWRLLLPYYFQAYDQLAYLDNDVLVTTDVNELFDQLTPEDILGGVLDYEDATHPNHNRAKEFFLPSIDQYIDAGVFVANARAYRAFAPFDKMMAAINRRNYPYGDQNIINIVFYQHIHLLPWRFNLQYDDRLLNKYEHLAPQRVNEIRRQLDRPGIIHFASNGYFPMPWDKFTPITRWERMWWQTFAEIKEKQLAFLDPAKRN
ncbi:MULTISPECIES: glycosyltransferase [Lacticaseibacillus]|uniref:Glycosyl transferase n=2 Tax=Lacticaseibacillus TaxID=2759736 RepID=A0AAN1C7T8_LACCA|nr:MULTISPECIES: glycosyltransferase [Lacticaseibacillus]ARY91166.1 glycosyl transferase [Lacticaseibacillus casei]KAB1969089.1 glycosyl transferase [Lacticaseibacillus casei]WLV81780.1 glycosyltransferase [Lacticaseibacillus sp. NCIMB 15473]WNX25731.1 glycosyltransferase [Lacticaseibacillus casei]WNX28502.1 glycosyltransferase [Lacticaseibacillus casei]